MNQQVETGGTDNLQEKNMNILDLTSYKKSTYSITALVIGVLLIIIGIVTSKDQSPPTWLTAWTAWAIDYIGLVVAAGAFVGVTTAAIDKLNKG